MNNRPTLLPPLALLARRPLQPALAATAPAPALAAVAPGILSRHELRRIVADLLG